MSRIVGKCYLDEDIKKIILNKELMKVIYEKEGVFYGSKKIGIGIQTFRRWLDKNGIERKGKIKYLNRKNNPEYFSFFKTGGYICIKKKGWKKEIRYHKYLMEEKLGRKLLSNEHVHHLDGNKENNDLKNLVVISCKEHMKIEEQLRTLALELYKRGKIVWDENQRQYKLNLES